MQDNASANNESSLAKQASSAHLSKLERALAKRAQAHNVVLVLDTSGSMAQPADSPGERRIDALRGVVSSLREQGIAFRQLCFNSDVFWSDIIPEPAGGTNLAGALSFCEKVSPQHVIIVSDGQPDSRDAAITIAKRLGCQIDVFFVGPQSDIGSSDFMRSLAQISGGSLQAVSFKELKVAIAGMLTAGQPKEEKDRGSIAL